jgi:hypothetical protein
MAARLTPEVRALRAITERQWQATVEKLMTAHGWHWYHATDNRPVTAKSGRKYVQNIRAGWPDLFAVKGPRLLAVELKREEGKTSREQDAWLRVLAAAGVEVHVWKPRDLAEVRVVLAKNNA